MTDDRTNALVVYEPPMCCSTGLCGPELDTTLMTFADDARWLTLQGVEVTRFNLAQDPKAFVEHPQVLQALRDEGEACLPLVMVDGAVVRTGRYPTRQDLATWFRLEASQDRGGITELTVSDGRGG